MLPAHCRARASGLETPLIARPVARYPSRLSSRPGRRGQVGDEWRVQKRISPLLREPRNPPSCRPPCLRRLLSCSETAFWDPTANHHASPPDRRTLVRHRLAWACSNQKEQLEPLALKSRWRESCRGCSPAYRLSTLLQMACSGPNPFRRERMIPSTHTHTSARVSDACDTSTELRCGPDPDTNVKIHMLVRYRSYTHSYCAFSGCKKRLRWDMYFGRGRTTSCCSPV